MTLMASLTKEKWSQEIEKNNPEGPKTLSDKQKDAKEDGDRTG